jgi:hypothetical protein
MKQKVERRVDTDFVLSSLIYKQKSCEICSKKHNEAKMILCDRCEDAFHIKCINLSYIPSGTWICRQCVVDINLIKQTQMMSKRPVEKGSAEECARCKKKVQDTFEYEEGDDRVKVQARFLKSVTCVACQNKFHSLCFSPRPQALNCSSC